MYWAKQRAVAPLVTTALDLSVDSAVATDCAYSLGAAKSYAGMTPFSSSAGDNGQSGVHRREAEDGVRGRVLTPTSRRSGRSRWWWWRRQSSRHTWPPEEAYLIAFGRGGV